MNTTELNFSVLLSNRIIELAKVFEPHNNLPALDIYRISGNLNLPKTSSIMLSNYVGKEEEENENCPIAQQLMDMN